MNPNNLLRTAILAITAVQAAQAAPQTWDGGTANWNTSNWDTGTAWVDGNDAVVNTGMVLVTSAPAANSVTLNGGQFSINADNLTIASAFFLNGTVAGGAIYMADLAAGQTTDLTGIITLNSTSNIGGWWNDKTMKVSGQITGSGGLVLESSSGICARFLISGTANDYSGGTTVNGTDSSYPSMLYLGAANALPSGSALTLNNSNLNLNGYSQTLAKIDGSGSFSVQGTGTVTLGAGDTTSTYSGTISGAASLAKTGSGTLTISGFDAISSTGAILVDVGTLDFGSRQFGGHTSTSAPGIIINGGGILVTSAAGNTPLTNVTLNGGTLSSTNGGGTTWGAWNINGNVTSTGISSISDSTGYGILLNNVGTSTDFDVQGGTLTVSAILRDGRDAGAPYDEHATSLTKQGSGTLALSNTNTYTGDTTVTGGTLSLGNGTSNSSLADSADVSVAGGCTLILNFSGTDTIDELWLGGVRKSPGVYGAGVYSGVTVTGSGTLTVSNGPPASDYETWAGSFTPAVGLPTADDDGDGLSNQEEYAFALLPNDASSGNPISAYPDKTTGKFSYTRRSGTGLTYVVESSTDLVNWSPDLGSAPESVTVSGSNETVEFSLTGPLPDTSFFVRVKAQ